MTTAEPTRQSSISAEALERITCYYDGIDDVVRELAEQFAADANSFLPDAPDVVAIELDHVQAAGRYVLGVLRQALAKKGELSREVEASLQAMEDCSNADCGEV